MKPVEVIYFPKPCPHCKGPLFPVRKMTLSWLECRNSKCPYPKTDKYGYNFRCAVNRH